jgi:hypothetical protein
MVYAPAAVASDICQTALAMWAYCAFTRRHERFASVFSDRYSEELFRRAAIVMSAMTEAKYNKQSIAAVPAGTAFPRNWCDE